MESFAPGGSIAGHDIGGYDDRPRFLGVTELESRAATASRYCSDVVSKWMGATPRLPPSSHHDDRGPSRGDSHRARAKEHDERDRNRDRERDRQRDKDRGGDHRRGDFSGWFNIAEKLHMLRHMQV